MSTTEVHYPDAVLPTADLPRNCKFCGAAATNPSTTEVVPHCWACGYDPSVNPVPSAPVAGLPVGQLGILQDLVDEVKALRAAQQAE